MTEGVVPPLAERVRAGDPRAMARAISLIEDESPAAAAVVAALYPHGGGSYLIGITGPPGAGKSTLVDRIAAEARRADRRVGVLAVDPTSPFTGGAVLGDRVRMQAHAADPGVFIRSMATRGHLGGLARATGEAAIVLEAAGFDLVVIETVGVGQDEVDVVRTADVSVVVLVPGAGDEVQALKAGIMEIGDVFVVNKADRDGAGRTVASIEAMLGLGTFGPDDWRPPVVRTVATSGEGVAALVDVLERFRRHRASRLADRRRRRTESRLRETLGARFAALVDSAVPPEDWERLLADLDARRVDPYAAADQVMRRVADRGVAPPLPHAGGRA